jgi:hypothetical protein
MTCMNCGADCAFDAGSSDFGKFYGECEGQVCPVGETAWDCRAGKAWHACVAHDARKETLASRRTLVAVIASDAT